MQKQIGIVGTTGKVPFCSFLDTPELLNKVGANTGNLVFQAAVVRSIKDEQLVVGLDLPWNPMIVRDRCRALVIPSANFIREGFDFTGFVNFLEQTELPLVVFGLGAQADHYNHDALDFHPSILRFMSLLKERCKLVSLRGPFTAAVLEKYGVSNVTITGCPSNFLNPDRNLAKKLQKKWNGETRFLATNGDEPWPKNLAKRDAERKLIHFASECRGIYVQQSVEPFMRVLRANNPYQSVPPEPHVAESLRKAIAPDMQPLEFLRFLVSAVRVYYDIDQWLEDLSRYDLSIGLRLHGNMVPFQSGCPAIWIYHDSRTRELAETMALPHVSVDEFLKVESIDQLKQVANADFGEYEKTRERLYSEYRRIISINDMSASDMEDK